jgi:hypothetical protein
MPGAGKSRPMMRLRIELSPLLDKPNTAIVNLSSANVANLKLRRVFRLTAVMSSKIQLGSYSEFTVVLLPLPRWPDRLPQAFEFIYDF